MTRPFQMQPRDQEIINHVFHYQYLQTRQIFALVDGSVKGIRRRLRKMVDNGFLVRLDRSKQLNIVSDHAYTLGPKGLELIAFNRHCAVADLPFSQKAAQISPLYLHHAIMVNDIRILIDLSIDHCYSDTISMARWIRENELADPKAKKKSKKFILCEEFKNDGKSYVFKPDAAFFAHKAGATPDKQMMFCIEADRGTEAIDSVIRRKLIAYNFYHSEAKFMQFDHCVDFRVLFIIQAKTDRRLINIRNKLTDMKGTERLRFALQDELRPFNFFTGEVWYNHAGDRVQLFRQ